MKLKLVIGINSYRGKSNNGKIRHNLFIDIDTKLPTSEQILKYMKRNDISNIQLWKSSKGHYWLTSFSSFTFREIYQIYLSTPWIDNKFFTCFLYNQVATLRLTKKNKSEIKLVKAFRNYKSKRRYEKKLYDNFLELIRLENYKSELIYAKI